MRQPWLLLISLACCSRDPPRPVTIDPRAPVRVFVATPGEEAVVTVEVADRPAVIRQGLMNRTELAPDHGMLFFMPREKDWSFWMQNTLIPLDIIFITKQLTVAGIVRNTTPRTEDPRSAGTLSLYVLEVNAGWADRHGVSTGAKVRFENARLRVQPL